jgi:hypothetical protein
MASGHVTALKGRTHGRTDQFCIREKVLANLEPSTHGGIATFAHAGGVLGGK